MSEQGSSANHRLVRTHVDDDGYREEPITSGISLVHMLRRAFKIMRVEHGYEYPSLSFQLDGIRFYPPDAKAGETPLLVVYFADITANSIADSVKRSPKTGRY